MMQCVINEDTNIFKKDNIQTNKKINIDDKNKHQLTYHRKYNIIELNPLKNEYNNQIYTNSCLAEIKQQLYRFESLSTEISNPAINQHILCRLNKKIKQVEEKYILKDSQNIKQFLHQNIQLIDLLLEAYQNIKNIFNNEKLVVKFLEDPEIINQKQLAIMIHTNLDADEAFDKLKELEDNWWLDASYQFNNDLDIHISFDEI